MEIPRRSVTLILFLLALVFQACEKPQASSERDSTRETKVAPSPVEAPAPAPAPPVDPVPAEPVSAPTEAKVSKAAPRNEPLVEQEPDLSVRMTGKKILISGAMRSRLQVERIVETVTREFPDHTVESELKIEGHRVPVGWGNRIADGLIVPYFQRIKDPAISYHDTIVTLEGTAKTLAELRMVTEVSIEMFSGGNTSDVDNRLKVEARPNP